MVNDDESNKRVTPERVRNKNLFPYAESPLDVSINLIVPQTGRAVIGDDLFDESIPFYDYDGAVKSVSFWDIFTIITSDSRLGNLTVNDKAYVEWALKCALLCRQIGLKKSCTTALSLAVSVVEPGLGLDGFLRKTMQTIKQETQHVQIEETPKKKNLFGMIKREG